MVPLSDWVAGLSIDFSVSMYNILEKSIIFGLINTGVPSTVIGFYNRVKKTQTGLLSINIMYVIILLLAIVISMLELGGF